MKNVITSKSSVDDMYNYYSQRYDKMSKMLSDKYGLDMYADKFDKASFRIVLDGMREEDRKTSSQLLINRLVTRQESQISTKQASAYRAEQIRKGEAPTKINDIRFKGEVWDEISNAYHKMKEDGLSWLAAKQLISNIYFGSE